MKRGTKTFIEIGSAAIVALAVGGVAGFQIKPAEEIKIAKADQIITLPEAIVETADGEITVISAPVVESVDGNQLNECPEGEQECGLGTYVYAPTSTLEEFYNYTIGKCWNVDGAYGSQCWDLAALHWMNYTENGRVFSTCGTGAAKGAWNCKEYNAGTEYDLVYEAVNVKKGAFVITGSGQYGHVCEALSDYQDGYVDCLGTNQGGGSCEGGGAAANVIRLSLKSFVGAFMPKTYIQPEPTPEPPIPITGCIEWGVQRGDTMSKIMLECENTVVYGEPMNAYAKTWFSRIVKPGQSVYDGWNSPSGVGLYAGDWIDHITK
ncbi:MAG: hypothetical protein IJ122_06000 [Methanobrevibacter sp.]|nr:hypothetical protein [Methanobrevibacter sp.]